MASADDHTGGSRDKPFGLNDDYVYEATKVKGADEYKQQARLESILGARDRVLEQRDTAYEFFWEGRIGHDDFLKAVRVGVEKYVLQSEWSIRNHKWGQWFWEGVPPTVDGRPAFDDEGNLRAIRKGQSLTDKKTGEEIPFEDLKNPVLMEDRNGTLPFGTEPNVLGELPMPELGRKIVFVGLESFVEAGDPIVRETVHEVDHPQEIKAKKSEFHEYQVPERVSLAAFRLVNKFWEENGMALEIDRGQSVIRDFDMSHQPEYRHTDGRPPV